MEQNRETRILFLENEKQQYLNHVQRLYNCVEHFLAWHRRMGQDRGEVNNEWIPRLLNDFIELKTRNAPEYQTVMRLYKTLCFTDCYLKQDRSGAFVFEVNTIEGSQQYGKVLPRIGDFLVGLYFPPEHYPRENGVYPRIQINVNDQEYESIQLDGTNRLYKPIGGNRFWMHLHMMRANVVRVHTNGKPFQAVEILGNTGKGPLTSYYFNVGFTCPTGRFFYEDGFQLWKLEAGFGDKYTPLCNDIKYSYVRAAMIIKRCFISYMKRKKRRIVAAEIKCRPGFGYEALKLVEKYTDDRRFKK